MQHIQIIFECSFCKPHQQREGKNLNLLEGLDWWSTNQYGMPHSGHKGTSGQPHFRSNRFLVQKGTQMTKVAAPIRVSIDMQIINPGWARSVLQQTNYY